MTKVRCKSEVIDDARTKGAKVHFASLMDICYYKDHQHLKYQHQMKWISYPDYQCAQDKQLVQYLFIQGKNGRYSKIVENSKIRMSRHLDTFTKAQMTLNHGPVWKIQSFLLSGICTVNPIEVLLEKVSNWA